VTSPSTNAHTSRTAPAHPFGFIPLGVGDNFSSLHYPTSLLIFLGAERLLIDCPSPLPKILHEAAERSGRPIALADLRHVILTHLHGDHSSGLECLGFYSRWKAERRAVIWTLPAIAADLWEHRLSASMAYDFSNGLSIEKRYGLEDFFEIQTLDPKHPAEICRATVHIRQTLHAPICFGVKIFFDGRSLGYSSDTLFDLEHIAFLDECDLIIHETGPLIHTHYDELAALPESTRRKIRLIHLADDFDPTGSIMPALEEGRYYAL
jgi:ribonuclease BN (tRNA processing enzyme)